MSRLSEFDRRVSSHQRGRAGEDAAARWLVSQGFEIIERNVRNGAGEIDLVARDGSTLCFLEVKSRGSTRFGTATAFVDARKQERVARAAALYLAKLSSTDQEVRFDVLGIERRAGEWHFELVKNAFEASGLFLV